MKIKKVCNKTRSPPASLLFKGQGTLHTTVKWPIIQLILGIRKTSREAADPRVIRRHRIGRPNAMASVTSDEAFLLMECIRKCALQERA